MLLFVSFLFLSIAHVFARQFKCENEIILSKFYDQKLAQNDGNGKLLQFICELEKQNLMLGEAFDENDADDKNFEKTFWTKAIKRRDPPMARCFEELRTTLNSVVFSDGTEQSDKLKKEVLNALFLLANRMDIPRHELIMPINPMKNKDLQLLRELAKIWAQNFNDIKSDEDEKEEKANNQNSNRSKENCWNSKHKNGRKKLLNLILNAIDDGNIMAFRNATKDDDGSSKRRRRRKKRDIILTGLIIILAAIIIMALITFASCSPSSSSDEAVYHDEADNGEPRRSTEIRVKFRYGANEFDEMGNRKSNHVYIVVGEYEYDYTNCGARSRKRNKPKNFPNKTFSFNHELDVQDGNIGRVRQIAKGMERGKWSKEAFDQFRLCLDFAYQFVCLLNDGICPPKEQWPPEFIDFDQRWVLKEANSGRISVFDPLYPNSVQNSELPRDLEATFPPEQSARESAINHNANSHLTPATEDYPWEVAYYMEMESP